MLSGYVGKCLRVGPSSGKAQEQKISANIPRQFLGGTDIGDKGIVRRGLELRWAFQFGKSVNLCYRSTQRNIDHELS